jgi:hypothetical protein
VTNEERYPKGDWQYDVANGDTVLGYADWLAHNIEIDKILVKYEATS